MIANKNGLENPVLALAKVYHDCALDIEDIENRLKNALKTAEEQCNGQIDRLPMKRNNILIKTKLKNLRDILYATEKDLMIYGDPPVNSPEVCERVRRLQPELDRLIRQEYEERVRFDIEKIKAGASNYVDYFRSVMERSRYKLSEDKVETAALSSFDDLKKSYADYLMACPMSPAKEQAYIAKRADNDMHRFGACHGIWNAQKRILKEKYGIEWYTPNETHPDIIFD